MSENSGKGSNASAAQMSAKQRQAKKTKKIILFSVEIVVILVMLFVAWQVFRATKPGQGPTYTEIKPEKLEIPVEIQENETMKGYMNIALFGVDATTESLLYRGSRSDSIMIASINLDTGDIRLVSVYRDTFLNTDDNNKYQKANHAYSIGVIDGVDLKGGPEPAIKMLNKNLDLNITDFVTVGYRGLSEVIDGLGGIYIDVDETELKHINNYQIGISESLKCTYTPVTETGYQLLDGIQASAYCRIRYGGGDDFKRASRQREVIKGIEEQAKKADLNALTKVFNTASKHIFTNLDSKDILEMIKNIANYRIVEEDGFPQENMRTVKNIGARGSCVVPTDLESNVIWLHQFLFEEQDYQVTDKVKEYSRKIAEETASYINE
ncbi:MAG: LCP family protein [Roseburia sp.]|nr:LCP family protein [Roseburia sp.]